MRQEVKPCITFQTHQVEQGLLYEDVSVATRQIGRSYSMIKMSSLFVSLRPTQDHRLCQDDEHR